VAELVAHLWQLGKKKTNVSTYAITSFGVMNPYKNTKANFGRFGLIYFQGLDPCQLARMFAFRS
jgi:hypothetical protein